MYKEATSGAESWSDPEGAHCTREKSGGMKMTKKKSGKKLGKGKKLESKKTLTLQHGFGPSHG